MVSCTGSNGTMKPRICNVGACFTDLVTYAPRLPSPGETMFGSKFSTGFGGKGANQAVQAARLGAKVMMISKVGDDIFGTNTLEHFTAQGVDATYVTKVPNVSSGTAPITVNESTGQNSIIIVPGALDLLTAQDVEAARHEIRSCGLMMVQLEAPMEANLAALKIAREEGVTTLLNTAPAKDIPDEMWSLCDIVCPNEVELQMLTKMPSSTDEEVSEAAKNLLQRGVKTVIVTLGERGCALFGGDMKGKFMQAPVVRPKDTTGAGDSFLGALAAHFVSGASLEVAIARANKVAAVSVTREGTQKSFPTTEEILARQAISLIDHTSLGLDDTEEKILGLVNAAVAEQPQTAAVCIYPKFVKFIRKLQHEHPDRYPRTLRVCTVVNFPSGKGTVDEVVSDTRQAVADGADEIDVVIDYNLLKENQTEGYQAAVRLVTAVRDVCPRGQVALKVIIESGELGVESLIASATEAAIAGGCDFAKTSTGKVKVNATPEAARIMLQTIAQHRQSSPRSHPVGFKAAGGVRDAVQAKQYLELAADVLLGSKSLYHEVDDCMMRFGASSLLPALRGITPAAPHGVKRKADDIKGQY